MKKPLLVLVDDDPAVLSALEAELTPAFGQVVRVAAFGHPDEVLDALPRWHQEGRAIAMAIVDQKMPGMTGVELIAALRASVTAADEAAAQLGSTAGSTSAPSFQPARHMRAALLTGYAGLESALAARNEANVDRYIEKPWVARSLHAMVRKLLARHVADTAQDHYLEFRELTTVDDIRRHLAMRYEVYSAAPNLRHLLPHYSRKRLDIDAYDTQSRFFGIFSVGPDGSEQIGGLRLIGTTHDEAQVAIVFLASQDDALRARAAKPTPYAIELPEKWPEPEALTSLLDLIRTRGEGVVEASRLVVTATHRGRSLGVGQVVLGLYESATTYVLEVVDTENVLQHCAQSHQAAAVRMGFRIAEGTTPLWSRRAQQYYVVLHGRGSHLTEPARERIRTIGRGVRARGAACRCPALQDCIGSAYASGDFSATDVFCPRLAQEVLVLPTGPMRAPEEGVIST